MGRRCRAASSEAGPGALQLRYRRHGTPDIGRVEIVDARDLHDERVMASQALRLARVDDPLALSGLDLLERVRLEDEAAADGVAQALFERQERFRLLERALQDAKRAAGRVRGVDAGAQP